MKAYCLIFRLVVVILLTLEVASACVNPQKNNEDEVFSYVVRVQESGEDNIIEDATVIIEVTGNVPLISHTDSTGYARISVSASYAEKRGRLRVEAAGHKSYWREMNISKGVLPDLIYLTSEGDPYHESSSAVVLSTDTPVLPTKTETAPPQPPTATFPPPTPTLEYSVITPTDTPRPVGLTSSIVIEKGVSMVFVPVGEFLMGSVNSDSNASENEKPQRSVYLDGFYMDIYEVTNTLYAECVANGGCPRKPGCLWYYADPTYANHPVVCVDWEQASTYCEWRGARLPSEAEWEKAARGTDGRIYPWGNNTPTCSLANYSGCVSDTRVVGSYSSGVSPYGLFDMAGNVWEWVQDWYSDATYTNSRLRNPTGPESGRARVLRGGSRTDYAWSMRTANRNGNDASTSNNTIGFRCARTP